MSGEAILIVLVVGALAGWLAGLIVRGTGFGLIGDIIIGLSAHSLRTGCFRGLGFNSAPDLSAPF